MDGRQETCTVNLNGNIILTIKTMALMKYPLRKAGYHIDAGTILVLGTERIARQFVEVIAETGDVEIVDNLNDVKVDNYKIAFYQYCKKDNPKAVIAFLNRTDIFSVVVVAGVVPKEFHEQFYIFKTDIPDAKIIGESYGSFKKFILSDVNYVLKELKLLETAGVLQYEEVSKDFKLLYQSMVAIGWIWKLFMRHNGLNCLLADVRFRKYLEDVQQWILDIERFEGIYGISEAIKSVLISYSVEKNLQFHEGMTIDSDLIEDINETVFFDTENYYFPEALLKKICTPLLDTISFLQLKREMYEEGMLMCNDNDKRNYTIKKEIYFPDSSTKIRARFLKIARESLLSDEGIEPLDYVFMAREELSNEIDILGKEVVEI